MSITKVALTNYILNEQIGVKYCHFLYFLYQLHLISHKETGSLDLATRSKSGYI